MAIIQSRVITLINSALDYQQALDSLIQFIHRQQALVDQSRLTPEAAFQQIVLTAQHSILMQNHGISQSNIAVEHYHFSKNAVRNAAQTAAIAKRRAERGQPPQRRHYISPFLNTNTQLQSGATQQVHQDRDGTYHKHRKQTPSIDEKSIDIEIAEERAREIAREKADAALTDIPPDADPFASTKPKPSP